MTDRYLRLLRAGIRHNAAVALARAGYDVIDVWPVGWVDQLTPLDRESGVAS